MFSGVNTEPTNKSKGIQCKECEGYGHIQAECANTCKKKKSYTVTWSDEEGKEDEGDDLAKSKLNHNRVKKMKEMI